MTDKKSQHISAIQQILAQFDIQTQVRRMTLEVMNSYTLGNKQAFSYIKEWESKFIQFQKRLVTAQTYYRNIQANINSKIEVTNSVNQHLQKFSQQFWIGMKESAQSLQQMRKNYINLVKDAGAQAATIRSLQKQVREVGNRIERNETKINDQSAKLLQKIISNEDQMTLKNNQRRSEVENILIRVSEAKSQLNSKAQTMQQLSKDLSLYKNEKQAINTQIANILQQLNNRVLVSDFNKIRVYIDNSTNQNSIKIQQNFNYLKQQIAAQISIRQRQANKTNALMQKNKAEIQIQLQVIKEKIESKHESVLKITEEIKTKVEKNYKQNKQKIDKAIQRIGKTQICIQELQMKAQQSNSNYDSLKSRIQEVESNIQSINVILKQIQKENLNRGQQLAQLKVDTDDKGDLGEQIKKIAQKTLAHDELLRKILQQQSLTNQKLQNYNNYTLAKISQNHAYNDQQFIKLNELVRIQSNIINSKYEQRCKFLQNKVQDRHKQALSSFGAAMKQKIDSIKDKFAFLEQLSSDMEVFKKSFEQQLAMNDQLNKQMKQKMDRMFSMITKLKSDLFLKIQTLGVDIGKNMNKIKQNSKILADLSSLASHFNQVIEALLSVELWRQISEDKDQVDQYKIASMLEGWVLQVNKDKAKYRGQLTTKRALIQICLEQHVKIGDKIKGGLIQNGKQLFTNMTGGSEQYQNLRRRSVSRKKQRQSQLPKVYR